MKTLLTCIAALLLVGAVSASGQSLQLPWSAQSSGGGASGAGGWTLTASIGQGMAGHVSGTNFELEGGFIPGTRVLSGETEVENLKVASSWNLVSVPVVAPVPLKSVLFPSAISNAFAYYAPPTGYAARETLAMGVAYWLKFAGSESVPIGGSTLTLDTVAISGGWNMIGTLSYPVLAAEIVPAGKNVILTPYYGFTAGVGYYTEDTLQPGLGYWVKVAGGGSLVLHAAQYLASPAQAPAAAIRRQPLPGMDELASRDGSFFLTIRDNAGHERTLAVARGSKDLDIARFELPPVPPAGIFDARFGSGQSLAAVDPQNGARQEIPIALSGAEYPVTVSWEGAGTAAYSLEGLAAPGKKQARTALQGAGSRSFTKADAAGLKLVFAGTADADLPKKFAVYQNYPNPFNPTTEITFDVPAPARVSLVVFNLLGEEVATLVRNEERAPGTYTVQFNAERLPSGLYFYRLQAGDDVQTKKMTLLR